MADYEDPPAIRTLFMAMTAITFTMNIIAISCTFISFYVLRPKMSMQKKLIIALQANDLVQAIIAIWRAARIGGIYTCGNDCYTAGFFTYFLAMMHWCITAYMSRVVYVRVFSNKRPELSFPTFFASTFAAAVVFGVLPLCRIPTFFYISYGWWSGLGSAQPVLAFFYVLVPILITMAYNLVVYIMISRKVNSTVQDSPKNSGPAYKHQAIRRLMMFPLAFVIIWTLPFFFNTLAVFSVFAPGAPGVFAVAFINTTVYNLSGFINSAVYLYGYSIFSAISDKLSGKSKESSVEDPSDLSMQLKVSESVPSSPSSPYM